VGDEPRPRSDAEEQPFTLRGHAFASVREATISLAGVDLGLPPKHNYPGSPANYWLLDESLISNMQLTVTPVDVTVPVFKMPHAVVEGVVSEVIAESDGDHHLWVTLDNSKFRLACEIAPQNPLPVPAVNAHVRVYGILRYDFQHGWWELHPVDFLEPI
jgi:hypothetical protein